MSQPASVPALLHPMPPAAKNLVRNQKADCGWQPRQSTRGQQQRPREDYLSRIKADEKGCWCSQPGNLNVTNQEAATRTGAENKRASQGNLPDRKSASMGQSLFDFLFKKYISKQNILHSDCSTQTHWKYLKYFFLPYFLTQFHCLKISTSNDFFLVQSQNENKKLPQPLTNTNAHSCYLQKQGPLDTRS